MRHPAADWLDDIVENAERIAAYLVGIDRAAFDEDGRTRDALERCVERVCEAVHRLGERAEALMPGHPWAAMQSTANRLRHAYDRIDPDVIWNAVCRDVPALAADARRALARLDPDGGRFPRP